MRYWLARLIYIVRRCIPLYANDNSGIYTAYSKQILQKLSTSNISTDERCQHFLYFSEHFIEDISGERLADALVALGEPEFWIQSFYQYAVKARNPRGVILANKTKAALTEKFNISFADLVPVDFSWSKRLEDKFNATRNLKPQKTLFLFNFFYWPYRIWRVIFPFKMKSFLGHAMQKRYLNVLSSIEVNDDFWLQSFERYSHLFKSKSDTLLMAENLKFRNPARYFAFLEFTYRVHRKEPKAFLFYRHVRRALLNITSQPLPEFRGVDLTTIFFNPAEATRQKQREKIEKKRKKIQSERQKQRAKLKAKAKFKAKKRLQERKKNQPRPIAFLAFFLPVTIAIKRLLKIPEVNRYSPAQLIIKSSRKKDSEFQYIPVKRKHMRSNLDLAIISITGHLDPLLDMSVLGYYSKVIILNGTTLEDLDLKETLQVNMSSDIEIDCFSPSRRLIKQYTQDHINISDAADDMAKAIINWAFQIPTISKYLESPLKEEYALSLSDNVFRTVEKFYAKNLFFETIDPATPVFFNESQDSFQFTLARRGFSKITVFGAGNLLGQTRKWFPEYKDIHPRRWVRNLHKTFRHIDTNIHQMIRAPESRKTKNAIIATHSRSSINALSTRRISEIFADEYNIQTIDIAPKAKPIGSEQNFYSLTTQIDRKLQSELRLALLPVISQTLSELPIQNYDPKDLIPEIAEIVMRNTGHLLGQTSLFRTVRDKYTNYKTSAAILVPGRYAEIRTIARAFQYLGLPTIDVQLLFLSKMARYKTPIATHHVVIDKTTRDFYIQYYGLKKDTINITGSITRDEDIVQAKALGRAASLDHFQLATGHSVITLACQPGFESFTQEAAKVLAEYLNVHQNINVCIKLHPAQSVAQFEALQNIFQQAIPEHMSDRWRVIHKDPFWKLIPATDVLISYFSNVCLQACAFDIPVLSLAGGELRPELDFEQIGLAKTVKDITSLPATLERLLNLSKKQRLKEPPYQYLQDNPHMADDQALDRLRKYVDTLIHN